MQSMDVTEEEAAELQQHLETPSALPTRQPQDLPTANADFFEQRIAKLLEDFVWTLHRLRTIRAELHDKLPWETLIKAGNLAGSGSEIWRCLYEIDHQICVLTRQTSNLQRYYLAAQGYLSETNHGSVAVPVYNEEIVTRSYEARGSV